MPDHSDSGPQPVEPSYRHGYWYNPFGHDWQFRAPITVHDYKHSFIGNQHFTHLPDDNELHLLLLDIDYGVVDEEPEDSGIMATWGFLLRAYLRSQVSERHAGSESTGPDIQVVVGKSYIEIAAASPTVDDLIPVWHDLAKSFSSPNVLYHDNTPLMGGQAAAIARSTQILSTALLQRGEVYSGCLWHNDMTLRTGLTGAALAPLDISHMPHRAQPAIVRLVRQLSPASGRTRHAFWATDASLMGIAFTQAPPPLSAEDFLEDSSSATLAYDQAGSLDTDDAQSLMSATFPVSLSGAIACELFAGITAQILHETVGERAGLSVDRFARGDTLVALIAAAGEWAAEDGRVVLRAMLGLAVPGEDVPPVPVYSPEVLGDHRIEELINEFQVDSHLERLLFMRRVEPEIVSAERVREHLERAVRTMHIPRQLARDEVATLYPPLLPDRLVMDYCGSGGGKALPPALEVDDVERTFFEPVGRQYMTRVKTEPGMAPFLAPHRLTFADDALVAEWFADGKPESALIRRLPVLWAEVAAVVTVGESTVLMDTSGRSLFIVPTLFARAGNVYTNVHKRVDALREGGVPTFSGGERELRAHVRNAVAMMQQRTQSRAAAPKKFGNPMVRTRDVHEASAGASSLSGRGSQQGVEAPPSEAASPVSQGGSPVSEGEAAEPLGSPVTGREGDKGRWEQSAPRHAQSNLRSPRTRLHRFIMEHCVGVNRALRWTTIALLVAYFGWRVWSLFFR